MSSAIDSGIRDGSGDRAQLSPVNYTYLQEYVHRESGIVLDGNKHYLLEARLMPIVHQHSLDSLNNLCDALRSRGKAELDRQVVDAMTTNETLFFRDLPQFEVLRSTIIPELVEQHSATRRLSFWSAAASTGQEAYTLAMMLLNMDLGDWNIRIFGTDLSAATVERARAGIYRQIEVNRGLPAKNLVKYFTRAGREWRVKDELRRMTRFEVFDLRRKMTTLGPFDLVFCKNVLIYFDLPTKKKILKEIRGTLFGGGYLLLGGSETVLNLDNEYQRRSVQGVSLFQAP